MQKNSPPCLITKTVYECLIQINHCFRRSLIYLDPYITSLDEQYFRITIYTYSNAMLIPN